ncbi:MAG TPA: M15 family metallopeptidase [Pedobacter sp.]|uniref:M15 family metallopeptidase n=1 Tax=Pedobacter sp. TaxID=1411316 RepID=UPI002C5C4510|nr:M15 family metallopeptidase [Pedobacter sp.]HMI03743.1 M15 family metallopeptidase [Pedobacter sp.]
MPVFGKTSLKKLEGVQADLVRVLQAAIINSPVDFTIDYGVRSAQEQHRLWLKGRDASGKVTNKKLIVTKADGYKNKSNHQVKADGYGHAVDLYPFVNGKVDFEDLGNNLKVIAAHILATAKSMGIKIIWGGHWTIAKEGIVDKPHFQI